MKPYMEMVGIHSLIPFPTKGQPWKGKKLKRFTSHKSRASSIWSLKKRRLPSKSLQGTEKRWSPSSSKWSYGAPIKWPCHWVTWLIAPKNGVITLRIYNRRGKPTLCHRSRIFFCGRWYHEASLRGVSPSTCCKVSKQRPAKETAKVWERGFRRTPKTTMYHDIFQIPTPTMYDVMPYIYQCYPMLTPPFTMHSKISLCE